MKHFFDTVAPKLQFTTVNQNSPRQIQIHHSKFEFATANSYSPRQIQIHHSKFKFAKANSERVESVDMGSEGREARRGTARDSEGRAWSSSFFYQT